MWVILFILVQFIILGVFVVFISDFRKKTGMVPLVNEKITKLLKFSYFGPLIICGYTLAIMDYLTYFDFLALSLTVLGTIVVVKSKLDLGICHTWAGYCKKSSELEVRGIYAYMPHPLYTGIHLFSVGELVMLTLHAPWYLTLIAIIWDCSLFPFFLSLLQKKQIT